MATDFVNQPRIGQKFIQSTAGAVSVKNKKGELKVEKVNVHRYIAGKKPEWAPEHSDDEEEEEDSDQEEEDEQDDADRFRGDEDDDTTVHTRSDHGSRFVSIPEVVTERRHGSDDDDDDDDEEEDEENVDGDTYTHSRHPAAESSDEEMLDEDAIERRRESLKKRALANTQQKHERDLLEVEEEEDDEDEEEESESEYEEYSDSDEESGLRLKPVFVRKDDRVTVQERDKIFEESEVTEEKQKKILEERKRVSTKIVNEIIREEIKEAKEVKEEEATIVTDDENDEEEYEGWKLRELKRIKRDKEEREARERDAADVERRRNMTEEERRDEARRNPKIITNKGTKGKYKFLQKYYHRGAFFMDKEEDVYKQDFSGATLEDHFEKTVLPKVMQVKNFGRSGRTKYTHLLDQDTTETESPWFQETAQSLKFHSKHGGGNKQHFNKPSHSKKDKDR